MSVKGDLVQLLKPYFLVNILLSLSYVVLKRVPGLCNHLFSTDDCEFDGRETEILFFLLIVVVMRSRKSGNVTMLSYLSSSFMYTKLANLILWFNADYLMGIVYAVLFVLGALLVPEPVYSSPDRVVYFRGLQALTEQLQADQATWLVAFYVAWSPACVNFAPVFAKLSNDFGVAALKFGKMDVGRYPEAGAQHRVSDSSLSKQLPTVILFQEGREVMRRPAADASGKLSKFLFSEENVRLAFGLSGLYERAQGDKKRN
ncbi:hypothetical protein HUJ04_000069 [Dendroctonus ponderosae]